jgi:hypothetical protein
MFQRIVEVVDIRNARFSIERGGQRTTEFDVWVDDYYVTSAFEWLDEKFDMIEWEYRYLNEEEYEDEDEFWRFALYAEISDEELGNDRIYECIPDMLFNKLEVEIYYLKTAERYRYTLALLQAAAIKNGADVDRLVAEATKLGEKLESHWEHIVDWLTDIDAALGKPQQTRPLPAEDSRLIDPATFYRTSDGRPMSSQEQIAHLLDLGGIDAALAAAITRSTRLSIEAYRKPSSTSRVPPAIIRDLELHFFERLTDVARSAGYELKAIKEEAAA